MQKFRITLILGVLMLGVLQASGYGSRTGAGLQSGPPGFITVGGLPVGTMGQQYQYKFEAIGGTPPYIFSDFEGNAQPSLPAGLTLDINGNLSGIPDTSGQYTVGFKVTDSKALSTSVLLPMDILTPDGVQGVRRLMMTSAKGDYIGQGTNFFYGDYGGIWVVFQDSLTPSGEPTGFSIHFTSLGGATPFYFWDVSMSTKELGVPFTTGVYSNTQRWPFEETGHAGLDVGGDGRGCNMSTGTFTVNTVSFDPAGNLETLDATFTQYCEIPKAPPSMGHIIYGLAAPDPSDGGPLIRNVTYSPEKGVIVVTGRNINHECTLLVDGIQLPIDSDTIETEKVGTTIKVKHDNLSSGVHQVQIGNMAGQLSPEFALSVR